MTPRNDLLDRAVELFPEPEGALQHVLVRHERRQRARRLAAGATVVAIAIGIGLAAMRLSRPQEKIPATPVPPMSVTEHDVRRGYTTSFASGAGSLWVGYDGNGLVRIDPATGEEVARIDTARGVNALVATETGVWVLTYGYSAPARVLLVDAATNTIARSFDIPGAEHLWASDGSIWVQASNQESGDYVARLYRIDPSTGAVDPPSGVVLSEPYQQATVGGGAMWTVAERQGRRLIVRVDPATGVETTVAELPHAANNTDLSGRLLFSAGRLWSTDDCAWNAPCVNGRLWSYDPATNQLDVTPVGNVTTQDWADGPRTVNNHLLTLLAADDRAVWVMAYDEYGPVPAYVIRYDISTGDVTNSEKLWIGHEGAIDGDALWLVTPQYLHGADSIQPQLFRIDQPEPTT